MADYSRFFARHINSEDNPEQLRESYKLRYQVYCQESGFLPEEPYKKTGLEKDNFDKTSEHIIVEEKTLGAAPLMCGTIRLVRYTNELGLPTKQFYPDLDTILPKVPLEEIAEISRLCISKKFRRRLTDDLYGIESYVKSEKNKHRKYPIVLILLFKKMYLVSKEVGINYWLATIEERLAKVLANYSIHLTPLMDGLFDYYGDVRPYFGSIDQLQKFMAEENPHFCSYFETDIDQQALPEIRNDDEALTV